MTNICVIGGNGFVGTNLLNRLKNNDDNEINQIYCGDLNKNNSKNYLISLILKIFRRLIIQLN